MKAENNRQSKHNNMHGCYNVCETMTRPLWETDVFIMSEG